MYTREQQAQDWVRTQNSLGVALQAQGERAVGAESQQLLSEAVATFRLALQVRTREKQPQDWASTQYALGLAFEAQSEQAAGADSHRLLGTALQSYRQILDVYPDHDAALNSAFRLYQERLFEFEQAYAMLSRRVQHYSRERPLGLLANFAEAHLTTGRFQEAAQRTATLLGRKDLAPSTVIGLRVAELLSLKMLGAPRTSADGSEPCAKPLRRNLLSSSSRGSFGGAKPFCRGMRERPAAGPGSSRKTDAPRTAAGPQFDLTALGGCVAPAGGRRGSRHGALSG